MPTIDEIVIGDPADAWRRAGFAVEEDPCLVGTVRLRLAGSDGGRGLLSWSLRDVTTADLDGLPTTLSSTPRPEHAKRHPNAVSAIDHVVILSPALDRTIAGFRAAGLHLSRVREGPTPGGAMRQAFFRLGEVVAEVIEQPKPNGGPVEPDRPAKLWGLAFRVADLDHCVAALGDRLGSPRDAVQSGRRIATLRRRAGPSPPVAFITAPPPEVTAG